MPAKPRRKYPTANESKWVARRAEKQKRKPRTRVSPPLGELPKISPYGDRLGGGRLFNADFTTAKGRQVLAAVRKGLQLDSSAAMVGVTYKVLKGWLREGAQIIDLCPDGDISHLGGREKDLAHFVMDMQKAITGFQNENLKHIRKARGKWWQASAWLLERRLPDQWGRHERITHEDTRPASTIDAKILIASPEGVKAIGDVLKALAADQPALERPRPRHSEGDLEGHLDLVAVPATPTTAVLLRVPVRASLLS